MNEIISIIKEIDFENIYINLCNKYNDVNNGNSFTKKQIEIIINNADFDLKYSSKEKLFYQDYIINDWSIRFILPYKYGFIDCSYTIYNDKNRFGGSFGEFCEMIDMNFENKISYKFPIATSLVDFKEILDIILKLNKDFLAKFKKKMEND